VVSDLPLGAIECSQYIESVSTIVPTISNVSNAIIPTVADVLFAFAMVHGSPTLHT